MEREYHRQRPAQAREHAEVEIRKVATAILKILSEDAPNMFGDYRLETLDDGTEVARTDHGKV